MAKAKKPLLPKGLGKDVLTQVLTQVVISGAELLVEKVVDYISKKPSKPKKQKKLKKPKNRSRKKAIKRRKK